MLKTLVIVESPSKAKTINKFLGNDYVVEATVGHIKNLPSNKINVDIENGYKPTYEVIKGKEKVIKQIKSLAKQSANILIATDPDREGEAIAADVYDYIQTNSKNIKRVLFNEITKSGIELALKNPKEIDWNLVESQTARRVMDRILGYKVSPFLWKTFYFGLSAGRVQSVALKLICEREEEIGKFKPKEYWSIEGIFSKISGSTKPFKAKLYKINKDIIKYNGEKPCIENIEQAHKITEVLKGNKFLITDVQTKLVSRKPQPPFTTSMLQQAASTRLGCSAKKTMMLAQKLYEGVEIKKGEGNVGLITYMRTDSTRISNEAVKQVREYIGKTFGNEYVPKTANVYGKKVLNAQEAHEAIRPTDVNITPDTIKKLDKSLAAMYKLIWDRFVASQMENAILDQKTILMEAKNVSMKDDVYIFKATGSERKFDGFLKIYIDVKEDDVQDEEDLSVIPLGLEKGDKLNALNIDKYQHFTNPPPRYTESSLIKQLESLGIGRPSTFALIVSTVIDRKYVDINERRLYATKLGIAVNKILMEHFPDVINYKFTANMEEELDTIANGKSTYKKVLDDFYIPFEKDYLLADSKAKDIKARLIEKTDILCPECGAETGAKMLKKWGRNGLFLTCERYPKCKGSMSIEDDNAEQEPQPSEEIICDKCGAPMAVKISKYGKFYGCTNYPKCKNTKPITLGIKCPKCGKGEIVPRMSGKSKKKFYGCTNYPNCDFITNFEPVIQACDKCGNNYLEKKKDKEGTEFLQCPKCKEKYKMKEE